MGADPVGQMLDPRELRKCIAGHAQRCDEQLGLADLAPVRIDDAELLARVVNEQLLVGHVRLPHSDRQTLGPFLIDLAKPAISVWSAANGALTKSTRTVTFASARRLPRRATMASLAALTSAADTEAQVAWFRRIRCRRV